MPADVWITDENTVRFLLSGADERDALVVLDRLGVDRADPAVSVHVARPTDLLDTRPLGGQQRVELSEPPAARATHHEGGRHAA